MFDENSRYAGLAPYPVVDRRGREVAAVPPAPRPVQSLLGLYLRKEGERLDHYAAKYLRDATAYWRIAEMNDAMLPESLAEAIEVSIPRKTG